MLKKLEYVCDTDSRFFVEKANDRDKLFQPVHLEGKKIFFIFFIVMFMCAYTNKRVQGIIYMQGVPEFLSDKKLASIYKNG